VLRLILLSNHIAREGGQHPGILLRYQGRHSEKIKLNGFLGYAAILANQARPEN
jgi:hypothetical protein